MILSDLLDKILERPVLYVGKPAVSLIVAFIQGYEFAKFESKENEKDKLYNGFQVWVQKRFKVETSHHWSSIITFMGSSESGAYDLLKELWDEYKVYYYNRPKVKTNFKNKTKEDE